MYVEDVPLSCRNVISMLGSRFLAGQMPMPSNRWVKTLRMSHVFLMVWALTTRVELTYIFMLHIVFCSKRTGLFLVCTSLCQNSAALLTVFQIRDRPCFLWVDDIHSCFFFSPLHSCFSATLYLNRIKFAKAEHIAVWRFYGCVTRLFLSPPDCTEG